MANTTSHNDSLETKKEDKPRWIYFFDRDSHKRYTEHLRDKEYNEIIETLRRSFHVEENNVSTIQTPIPPEEYFLTPNFHYPYMEHLSMTSTSSGTLTSAVSSPILTSSASSLPAFLHHKMATDGSRSRRQRTAAFICVGLLAITLMALVVGVVLHFLLETGSLGSKGRAT